MSTVDLECTEIAGRTYDLLRLPSFLQADGRLPPGTEARYAKDLQAQDARPPGVLYSSTVAEISKRRDRVPACCRCTTPTGRVGAPARTKGPGCSYSLWDAALRPKGGD
jgi:hypothetical protein